MKPIVTVCIILVYFVNFEACLAFVSSGAPRVVLPARADALGHVISNDLTFHQEEAGTMEDARRKRHTSSNHKPNGNKNSHEKPSSESPESLYVVIYDEEEEILLQLEPNTKLVSPLTVIEWFYEDGRHVVRRMQENCFYSGRDVRAKGHSLVAVSNCDGLVGYIQTNNESYFIEPLTNELRNKLLQPGEEMTLDRSQTSSRISGFDRWTNPDLAHDGPRPHLIYKVNSLLEKLNLSADQDFKRSHQSTRDKSNINDSDKNGFHKDESPIHKWDVRKMNSSKYLKGSARYPRSLSGSSSKYLKGGRRSYPWKRNSDSLSEYNNAVGNNDKISNSDSINSENDDSKDSDNGGNNDNSGNNDNNDNSGNNDGKVSKGGKRRKRNGCKKRSVSSSKNDVDNLDQISKEEEKCLTKKERREKKKEMKEKRRMEKEKRKREKEERKKEREKRKKKKKNKPDQDKQQSSVPDPLHEEDWEGYSPDLIWETQVAPGLSGLTELDFSPPFNQTDPQKWLELTVGVDYTVIDFHGEDQVEKYVFTLFNIVSAIYEDPSLQANLDIVLLRLIFYKDKAHSKVKVGLAKRSLEAVNKWAETLYRLSANHLQHDLAVWLTRLDLGGPSGYAPVSGVCDPSRSCTLNRDEGLTSAFIIAHEMGHVLGMSHDGDTNAGNMCEPEGRLGSVMAPLVAATFGRFHWSKCSRKEYHSSKLWECLHNKPEWENATVMSSSISYQYSLDDQCRMEFGEGFGLCRTFGMSDPCTFLWCSNMSTPHLCKTKKGPPLEGTICGNKMWCRQGFCEPIVDSDLDPEDPSKSNEEPPPHESPPVRHNPQHGGWSTWSHWGPCSRTCGTGMMFRTRGCNNPTPRWGGQFCHGKREEWKLCATDSCLNLSDMRADQCEVLSQLIKLGKRRSKLKWLPYESKRRRKKCRMTCVSHLTNEIYMGKEHLVDGTPCSYDDHHSVCVQGKCVPLGCDSTIGSSARVDECGVCRGNGSSCRRTTLVFAGIPDDQYTQVAIIPKGAWRISVQEEPSTHNFLAIRDNSSTLVLNAHHRQEPERDIISEGTMFHYYRNGDRESLIAAGPLINPVTVMVHGSAVRQEIKITTTFLMREDERDFYHWVSGSLTTCSATCGGGNQMETFHCEDLRTAAEVGERFCVHLQSPQPKTFPCSQFGCKARWITGPWEHCTATCGDLGTQHRLVSCVSATDVRENDVPPAKRHAKSLTVTEVSDLDEEYEYGDYYDADSEEDLSEAATLIEPPKLGNKDVVSELESKAEYSDSEIVNSDAGFDYVDPLVCQGQREPISERPCNRVLCPVYWEPQGWTECTVACGMGQQEVIYKCTGENEVGNTEGQNCGKRPREVRACYAGDCPLQKNETCIGDDSAFCQLSTLHRYCKIPKYYNLCCFTCFKVLNKLI